MKKAGKQRGGSSNKRVSPAARVILLFVSIYQSMISPWLGPSCRHIPSCSNYMAEAVREWGALKGGWMGVKRVARCHPWGTSGYDPVPRAEEKNR